MQKIVVAAMMATFILPGCATLLNGGQESLSVTVLEPQAEVRTRIEKIPAHVVVAKGERELRVGLDRGSTYLVVAESPNYETFATTIQREVHPAFWGNLALGVGGAAVGGMLTQSALNQGGALGSFAYLIFISLPAVAVGLLGLGVDSLNGTMWRHDRNELDVRLQPRPRATP